MSRTILVTILTVVLPVGLLAWFVAGSMERERRLHDEEIAATHQQLATERADAFDAQLRGELAMWLDAIAATKDTAGLRRLHDQLKIGQLFVVDRHGDMVYPPPLGPYAAVAWPLAEERRLGPALQLDAAADHAAAIEKYRELAKADPTLQGAAQFRIGLCVEKLGDRREAARSLDVASTGDGPLYFRLVARLEAARLHRAAGDEATAVGSALAVFEAALRHPEQLPRRSAGAYLEGRAESFVAGADPKRWRVQLANIRQMQSRRESEERLRRTMPTMTDTVRALLEGRREKAFVSTGDGDGILLGRRGGRIMGVSVTSTQLHEAYGGQRKGRGVDLMLVAGDQAPDGGVPAPVPMLSPQYQVVAIPADSEAAAAALRQRIVSQLLLLGLAVALAGCGGLFLVRAYRRAREASQAKSAFIARISHELKTPLTLIHGVAETLYLDRVSDPERKQRYLATLLRESEALGRMVQTVLDYSSGDRNGGAIPSTDTDIGALVGEVCSSIESFGDPHGLSLDLRLPDEPVVLCAEPEGIRLALLNLLANAVKFSPAPPSIEVAVERSADGALIRVSDRGKGISPEERARIFEPFVRGSAAGPGIRGAGLGLSLVRDVAVRHRGDVTAADREGGGAVFELLIREAGA